MWILLALACSGDKADDAGVDTSGTDSSATDTSLLTTDPLDTVETGDSGWEPGPTDTGPAVATSFDDMLLGILAGLDVPQVPLAAPPAQDPAMVALGEALFYDPILSGPKDAACVSCHHPAFNSGDGLTLAVGTGATGIGLARGDEPHPPYIPRHSQALFNVGDPSIHTLFWDGRAREENGVLVTDDPVTVPPGLNNVVALQAILPLLDRDEMAGQPGQLVDGLPCDVCDAQTPEDTWEAILGRLRGIDGYQTLFDAAGHSQPETWTIDIVGNALAAYQTQAFAATNTPWDQYLAGDYGAINTAQKLGANLFFGEAGCSECHSGPLFTDQKMHNTGLVQLGPGRPATAPLDLGRGEHTGLDTDRFAFRTPGLRNVELTAPYMHNGSVPDLESVTVHYGAPLLAMAAFDDAHLPEDLKPTVLNDQAMQDDIYGHLSPDLPTDELLVGLSNIREFLLTLTDPNSVNMTPLIPTEVPSGLPIP